MAFRYYLTLQHSINEETLCRGNNLFRMTFKDRRIFPIACFEGHMDIVKKMLDNSEKLDCEYLLTQNDKDKGLREACRGGHLDLVGLMIQHGASDWNWGLLGACYGGHIEIARLMIQHGATDWNRSLYGACSEGHIEIARLMIQHGATNWNWGL